MGADKSQMESGGQTASHAVTLYNTEEKIRSYMLWLHF